MFGWNAKGPERQKRMIETSGAYDGTSAAKVSGLVAGTKVATPMGWRAVEGVIAGDKVLTFDQGMQTVVEVRRSALWRGERRCPPAFWPLEVPAGALGNRDVMWLLPQQAVVVESDAAEACLGDPFALMPANALSGLRGIAPVQPHREIEIITLHFADDQVVFANSGALFFCPAAVDLLVDVIEGPKESPYHLLDIDDAKMLARYIAAEDDAAAPTPDAWADMPMYAVA